MKLFTAPGACSTASHIALREAGLDFEVVRVTLSGDPRTADGVKFQDINAKGYVPALEIAPGSVLTENVAILQFIADRKPETGLAPPPDCLERYRLQEWLGFINSDLHRSYTILFKTSSPNETTELFRGRISTYLDYLEGVLKMQRWLMGEAFTVADCYLFTVLSWSDAVGVDLSRWPSVARYCDAISTRDSVRAVLRWESHER